MIFFRFHQAFFQIPKPISFNEFYPVQGHGQQKYGGGLGGEESRENVTKAREKMSSGSSGCCRAVI